MKKTFLFKVNFTEQYAPFWVMEDIKELSPEADCEYLGRFEKLKVSTRFLSHGEIAMILGLYRTPHSLLSQN